MKKKTPADLLADAGRALYGEHWRVALARGIGVDDDTVRRWMTGRTTLDIDHPAFEHALNLLDERSVELESARTALAHAMRDSRG